MHERIKGCDNFVEPLELSLGFNAKMQKADTIQYIPLYKTLNVCLSHDNALSKVLKSQEVMTMFLTAYDGNAFKSNSL